MHAEKIVPESILALDCEDELKQHLVYVHLEPFMQQACDKSVGYMELTLTPLHARLV